MVRDILLNVEPPRCLVDERVTISLTGLQPGCEVLMRAKTNSLYDIEVTAESTAVLRANSQGIIDLSTDPSIDGTYIGVDAMGLFWSMTLSNMKYPPSSLLHTLISIPPSIVSLTAEIDGRVVASQACEREVLQKPRHSCRTGNRRRAIRIIPLSAQCRSSPGSQKREASSWSYRGTPVPFVKFRADPANIEEYLRIGRLSGMYVETLSRASREELEQATIRVEDAQCPIMIISGGDDAYGPQERYVQVISDRLRQGSFSYPFESLFYPKAGHRAVFPYVPTTQLHFVGGTPKNNAEAMEDAWRRMLLFLETQLG